MFGGAGICLFHFYRKEVCFEEKGATVDTHTCHAVNRSVGEGFDAADGVDARQCASQHLDVFLDLQIRGMASLARIYCITKSLEFKQALTVPAQGCYHWKLLLSQLRREGMFLFDLFGGPALWPVELGDNKRAVF